MSIRKSFIAIVLALGFVALTPGGASAQNCVDIGGSCRPGWISGCSFPEVPISGVCPANPNGVLVCCKAAQSQNDCTDNGGVCRSDYYNIFFPGEPACGYGSGVPSSDACSGPGQMCCVPPPNIGAVCNGGPSTCQLPSSCSTGTAPSSDCLGGTVCCLPPPPPSAISFSIPASCNIVVGASTCTISVGWSVLNPVNPAMTQDGTVFSTLASDSGVIRTINFGPNAFQLSDGTTLLRSGGSQGMCETGSVWDGSMCASSPPPPPPPGPTCASQGGSCGSSCTNGTVVGASDCTGLVCCVPNSGPTCASQGGACQPLCDLGTSSFVSSSDCTAPTGECCVPNSPPPPPPPPGCSGPGCLCTGNATGLSGVCRNAGSCNIGLETQDSAASCGLGVVCCVPASGPGPGPGPGPTPPLPGPGPTPPLPGPGPAPGPGSAMGATLNFLNPLKFDDINSLLCAFLNFLQGFIVVLSIIVIVIGGFIYITSAGNEGRLTVAKNCVLGALIGLALGIMAPLFLREIANLLGWAGIAACAGFGTTLSLVQVATNILNFLLSVVGVVALIMLVVGAFMYLTAAGDEGRIDTGKSIVKYAIIGITIALAALVLVRQVASFFS